MSRKLGAPHLHHKAHIPNTQDHLDFLVKGTKIAAINKDGSAHDKSHGIQMQKWAMNGAKQHYPDFKMPDDGLIEIIFSDDASLLIEAGEQEKILLSQEFQSIAEEAVQERSSKGMSE